jgi:hypothetical protein
MIIANDAFGGLACFAFTAKSLVSDPIKDSSSGGRVIFSNILSIIHCDLLNLNPGLL